MGLLEKLMITTGVLLGILAGLVVSKEHFVTSIAIVALLYGFIVFVLRLLVKNNCNCSSQKVDDFLKVKPTETLTKDKG